MDRSMGALKAAARFVADTNKLPGFFYDFIDDNDEIDTHGSVLLATKKSYRQLTQLTCRNGTRPIAIMGLSHMIR